MPAAAFARRSCLPYALCAGLFASQAQADVLVLRSLPELLPGTTATHKMQSAFEDKPVSCINSKTAVPLPCPERVKMDAEGQALVLSAFNRQDFARLDALYDRWCSGKDRFADGSWKLSQYEEGLMTAFQMGWPEAQRTVEAWRKSRPESDAALLAEGTFWHKYGWNARSNRASNTITKEAWELFGERLMRALSPVSDLLRKEAPCAAPYQLALKVLTDLGAQDDILRRVFYEGVRRFPEYHQIYFAMARHYEPKWGGSFQKFDTFVDESVKKTSAFEGMGMYARLYGLVDDVHGLPFRERAPNSPSWSKLREGYEDLRWRYPDSLINLVKFTGTACRSSDSELYRTLRERIVGHEDSAPMLDPIDVCDRRHGWKGSLAMPVLGNR